ncbi:Uncharacterised protein [Burkholderia pseudomallei]|nr:Uncharacterised protein [Burkholderia pseudomallei]CAJ2849148.1 Uncharacterised protein [Burkholderia pseudomallei]CAJ2857022.1 Uncharacterised protein [Burkholderia pseudomallei]CAJ2887982.1 Uncharacterised protein [Burkholderia pseudomallei]CAJ2897764.1 Uncharacterised protein [Burkholderia pseudomallei]
MTVWVSITTVHLSRALQSIWAPQLFILSVNKNVIVIFREPLCVIRDSVFLLPDGVGHEIPTTKYLVTKHL